MWIIAAIIANIAIWWLERTYRTVDMLGWSWETFLYVTLAVVASQLALSQMFKLAPSLIVAGAMFTVSNAVLRVVNTHIIGEEINNWVYLGVTIMMVGVVIISYSKTLVT